jgi:hypothetical protein
VWWQVLGGDFDLDLADFGILKADMARWWKEDEDSNYK